MAQPSLFHYPYLVRSILTAPTNYGLCFIICAGIVAILLVSPFLEAILPFAGSLIASLADLYLAIVLARLVGIFYHTNRFELKWFRRK